ALVHEHVSRKVSYLLATEPDRYFNLSQYRQSTRRQSYLKCRLVNRLKKSMAQFVIDLVENSDNLLRQVPVLKTAIVLHRESLQAAFFSGVSCGTSSGFLPISGVAVSY